MDYFEEYHPGLSVDCVIFGFHENELKILPLQMHNLKKWAVPGGFRKKDEETDDAANRILEERTGLKEIFLEQFHLFGNLDRHDSSYTDKQVCDEVISPSLENGFSSGL